ncbi:MFS transporter [Acetobacter sp. DsW_063]|uniref:MFS transporter n=1 Tax=Acetobacter sp. DsW_063 TaxID=1514894 RepID=UPI000A3ABE0C|nr:MFS transporter [Acetobacter sp. DsW_063]
MRAKLVFGVLYLIWLVSYVDRAVITYAAPVIATEFALNHQQIGWTLGAFYLGYAAMQIPAGWLADRFGARVMVLAGVGFWSLFTLLTGLSGGFAALLAVRLLFGLGEGLYPPASVKMIRESFSREKAPLAASLLMSSSYLGLVFTPPLLLPLLGVVGWRTCFEILAGLGVAMAVIFALTTRPSPGQSAAPQEEKPEGWSQIIRRKDVWRLMLVWFVASLVNKGLDGWMPTFLLRAHHVAIKSAGALLAAPNLAATLGSLLGGWIVMRFFSRRADALLSLILLGVALSLAGMATAGSVNIVILFESIAYFFKGMILAVITAIVTVRLPRARLASGNGFINFGGQMAGFVALPMMGVVLDATGSYAMTFALLMVAVTCGLALNLGSGRLGLSPEDQSGRMKTA